MNLVVVQLGVNAFTPLNPLHIIELIQLLSYCTLDSDSIDSSALSLTQDNRYFFLSYGIHVEELG